MKSKKIIIAFLCVTILLAQILFSMLSGKSYAVENKAKENFYYNKFDFREKVTSSLVYNKYGRSITETKENSIPTFTTSITSEEDEIYLGDEFELSVKINDFVNIEKGIIVVYGKLNYDSNVLDLIEMIPQKEWQIAYNEKNQSFVMDNEIFINNENIEDNDCILKIKFKAKDTITEETNTTVEISNILGSNSKMDIISERTMLDVSILKEEPPVEPIFTSEKYKIEENHVTRIPPNTTFGKFKSNIETNQELVLRDRAGNILDSDFYGLATNMTLTVGEGKVYTLVVIADIADMDGNGQVTITDLAQLKLHYIGLEQLSENALRSADINDDGVITITDIAQLKLYLIGLLEIK